MSDKNINLKSILQRYELVNNRDDESDGKNSNKTLADVYSNLLNGKIEPKYDMNEINKLIEQSISVDYSAYKKLKQHKNNYISEA